MSCKKCCAYVTYHLAFAGTRDVLNSQGNGLSSNGRTADSGSVSEGSTPSSPAIKEEQTPNMARSSSG